MVGKSVESNTIWRSALGAVLALLVPVEASAHPHIWISQRLEPVAEGGRYTGLDIEWRFDPESSENEIAAIDRNSDGVLSVEENNQLIADTLVALEKAGFMSWLNTGGTDFRPTKAASFKAVIENPASFTPPDWDRHAGDKDTPAREPKEPKPPPHAPRNLVYKIRIALPQPVKAFTITTFDPEDFIRVEVDKAKMPAGCTAAKHATYKSEFIPGHPVFADTVRCALP